MNEQTNTKAEADTSTISTPRKRVRPQLSHANQPLRLQHMKMGDIVLLFYLFFLLCNLNRPAIALLNSDRIPA